MSDKITQDIHGFEPGAVIELFELDLSTGSASSTEPVFRWHSGINENMQEIVWQGNRYAAFPIEADGFEFSGKGAIPRPTLTVANITSMLTQVINSYDDLVGSKVTRKKTFAKYLDSYCYTDGYPVAGVCTLESGGDPSLSKSDCLDPTKNGGAVVPGVTTGVATNKLIDSSQSFTTGYIGGTVTDSTSNTALVLGVVSPTELTLDTDILVSGESYTITGNIPGTWTVYNPATCEAATGPGIWYASALADDTAHFSDEIWYIDRKAVETRTHIQFELTAAHDIQGVKLPARTVTANSCAWRYKGVECGYSGDIILKAGNFEGTTTVVAGVLTSVSIDSAGTNYTVAPTVNILTDSDAVGSGATATATIASGSVSTITITSGGSGYGKCSDSSYTTSATCVSAGGTWDDTHPPQIFMVGGGSNTVPDQFWDIANNTVASSDLDVCSKTFNSCELRFPESVESPFGGFPGAGINMG